MGLFTSPSGGAVTVAGAVNKILSVRAIAGSLDALFLDNYSVAGAITYPWSSLAGNAVGLGIVNDTALTSATFSALTSLAGTLSLYADSALASVSFPLLAGIAGTLDLHGNNVLTALSLPSLSSCAGTLNASSSAVSTFTAAALTAINGLVNLDAAAISTLSLPALTAFTGTLSASSCPSLQTVSLGALTNAVELHLASNTILTSVDLSALTTVGYLLTFAGCTLLGNLTLTALSALGSGSVDLSGCTALSSLTLSGNVSTTDGFSFNASGCALDEASVDNVLASFAAGLGATTGTIDLSGGTNAIPTDGAANTDYVSLTGAGITVNINT